MYGVDRCIVGYSGGDQPNPTYSEMKDHTESFLVEFDKSMTSYDTILMKWMSITTPYEADLQYRSAVFFLTQGQKETAKALAGHLDHVHIGPATKFYMAEDRHQDFLARL